MYSFKHEIKLKSEEKVYLFGEDYFNDKRVFYEQHISMLNKLCNKVFSTGFPILINDLQSKNKLLVKTKTEFKEWLKLTQP